eukprot:1455334-Pyramimonas_sp.AAC.2
MSSQKELRGWQEDYSYGQVGVKHLNPCLGGWGLRPWGMEVGGWKEDYPYGWVGVRHVNPCLGGWGLRPWGRELGPFLQVVGEEHQFLYTGS